MTTMTIAKKRLALQEILKLGTAVVRTKEQQRLPIYHKQLAMQVYKKQADSFESDFTKAVNPIFKAQVDSAVKKLRALGSNLKVFKCLSKDVEFLSLKGDVHKFSSTQFNIEDGEYSRTQGNPEDAIKQMAADIPDSDLTEDGRETEFHITVKYGIHTEKAELIREVVVGFGPVIVTLGKTSIFKGSGDRDFDVVKIDVGSDDLHRLNKLISDSVECTDTFADYHPHLTLAYVKKGLGEHYVGNDAVDGMVLNFTDLLFSDKNRDKTEINLMPRFEFKDFDGLKCGGPGSGVPGPCPLGSLSHSKDSEEHTNNVRREIELAGNEIRNAARGKMQEFGILLDKTGKPLGPMVHGGEDTVNDYPSQHLFDVRGSNLSLIHNHPMREGKSLTELSPGDLYTLGKPGMSHMVVVHPYENDTITIATRTKDIDQSAWFNAVTSAYRIANDYTHQSKEGKRIAEDNDFAFLDTHRVAIKILQNLGYIELDSNAGGSTKKHLDQYGDTYDRWAKSGADDFIRTKSFKSTKTNKPSPSVRLDQIFNPSDWDKQLKQQTVGPVAKAMAESALAQYLQIKDQIKSAKSFDGLKCGGAGGTPGPCPTGGGKNKTEPYLVQLDKAVDWVHAQSEWKDKVDAIPKTISIKSISPDAASVRNASTVKKYEKQIVKEIDEHGSPQQPMVVSQRDDGRYFLHDGNHYFDAIKNLVKSGKIKLDQVTDAKVVEVVPKAGHKFVTEFGKFSNSMTEVLVSSKSGQISIKASTATEWLDSLSDEELEPLKDVVFQTPYGNVSMRFATEYPLWMKKSIEARLQETFAQPYWNDINTTTGGDIDSLLTEGLQEGWSINDMADEMEDRYGSDAYPKMRGKRIARTESGNALNGSRSDVIDNLKAELGDKYPMRKVWLSVLGNTTRDDHAHLDGVPAADDGRWSLGGIRCRWPGDVQLPADQRINCQCSLFTQLGMVDADANELIAEHEVRQAASGKMVLFSQLKCGGPGSGVPGPCPQPKLDEHGKIIPGSVGASLGMNTSHSILSFVNEEGLAQVHAIEKLLHEGNHAAIIASAPNSILGKIAKQSALDIISKQTQSLPPGALPTKIDPNVASPAGWKKIGDQLGTEKGGTYELAGQKYYVKQPDDIGRAHNEVLALKLYEMAGGSAVAGNLVSIDGKQSVATKWVDNSEKVDWTSVKSKVAAADDFAIHVWLNNRDAIGAGSENPQDNIRWNKDTGKLTLVDAGGSLNYKGMGGGGKKPFTKNAAEWDTFRDPSVNPTMAKVYGGLTPQQLIDSAKKMHNISNDQINHLVDSFHHGSPLEKAGIKDTLIARRDHIIELAKKLENQIASNQPHPQIAAVPAIPPTVVQPVGHKSIAPSLPPPPNVIAGKSGKQMDVWQDYQTKYDAIYAAVQAGDQKALHAVKTNPDAKSPYPKALADYKKQAQAAMVLGGKPDPNHVVGKLTSDDIHDQMGISSKPLSAPLPPKPGQSNPPGTPMPAQIVMTPKPHVPAFGTPTITVPVTPNTPKIDASAFPSHPVFKSTLAHQVQENNQKIQEALDLAKKGDLIGLQGMQLTGSPKLASWHQDLVGNLSKQLNPPVPPAAKTTLTDDYAKLSTHISSNPQSQMGKDKIGYWVVLGQVQSVPSGIQPGTWQPSGSPKLWKTGKEAYEKASPEEQQALASYTTGGYHAINSMLRQGEKGSGETAHNIEKASHASEAVMKFGHEIQPGLMLSRKHDGVSAQQWATAKPGTVLSEKGILSTSVDSAIWSGATKLMLTVGTGVKGIAVKSFSENPQEKEVILPPNQRIMITHVYHSGSSHIIHGVILPTLPDQCCPP